MTTMNRIYQDTNFQVFVKNAETLLVKVRKEVPDDPIETTPFCMPFVDQSNTSTYAFQYWENGPCIFLNTKARKQNDFYDATFTLIDGRDQSQTELDMSFNEIIGDSASARHFIEHEELQEMLINDHFHVLFKFNNDHRFLVPPDSVDFTTAIVKNLIKYHEDEQHNNIVLEVNGKDIGAVKFTLCLHSDVFDAMFNGRWRESSENRIPIKDVDYDVMKFFVDCLQTGRAEFSSDPIFALKVAIVAKRFAVEFVEVAASNKALQNIDDKNFLTVIDFISIAMDQASKETFLNQFFKTYVIH